MLAHRAARWLLRHAAAAAACRRTPTCRCPPLDGVLGRRTGARVRVTLLGRELFMNDIIHSDVTLADCQKCCQNTVFWQLGALFSAPPAAAAADDDDDDATRHAKGPTPAAVSSTRGHRVGSGGTKACHRGWFRGCCCSAARLDGEHARRAHAQRHHRAPGEPVHTAATTWPPGNRRRARKASAGLA